MITSLHKCTQLHKHKHPHSTRPPNPPASHCHAKTTLQTETQVCTDTHIYYISERKCNLNQSLDSCDDVFARSQTPSLHRDLLHDTGLQLLHQQPHHTRALYCWQERATCHSRLTYLGPPAGWTSHSNTKACVFSEHASTGGWRRPARVTAAGFPQSWASWSQAGDALRLTERAFFYYCGKHGKV